MAKADLSVLLEGLRGSAGNVTFVKSREGTLVKPRVNPTNPQTKSQMVVRSAFTRAAQAWTTLTASQVKAWNEWAALKPKLDSATNKTTRSTGFNAFVKLTSKIFVVAAEPVVQVLPPTSEFSGDSITVTASATAPGVITFAASGENTEDVTTELLLQRLPSATRKPSKEGYRVQEYVTFEGVTPTESRQCLGWLLRGSLPLRNYPNGPDVGLGILAGHHGGAQHEQVTLQPAPYSEEEIGVRLRELVVMPSRAA